MVVPGKIWFPFLLLCGNLLLSSSTGHDGELIHQIEQFPGTGSISGSAAGIDAREPPSFAAVSGSSLPLTDRRSASLARNILDLGFNLGNQLSKDTSDKFVVFSPLSIAGALHLVLLGAKGKTHEELLQLLGYTIGPDGDTARLHDNFGDMIDDLLATSIDNVDDFARAGIDNRRKIGTSVELKTGPGSVDHRVSIVNGIFVQKGYSIRPDYKTAVQSVYRSEFNSLDFSRRPNDAANFINSWVERNTNGKIKDIVSGSLSTQTRVVLASALYFNARWQTTFYEGATQPKEFFPDGLNGRSIMVDMMALGGTFPFYDAKEYDCRILGLPYKNSLSVMYVIMPNNSSGTKLRELQSRLTAEKIDQMIARMTKKTAVILFPSMHLSDKTNLRTTLSKLGVNSLFDIQSADLSLISSGDSEQISSVSGPSNANYVAAMPFNLVSNKEDTLIFSRVSEDTDDNSEGTPSRKKRSSYKVESEDKHSQEPLRLKDFIIRKRITKPNPGKKFRTKRDSDVNQSLKNLDNLRDTILPNPGLFADEIVHKVDLVVNEKGTEGGAATVVFLHRTGTDIVFKADGPFMFIIRNEATNFPIFYGNVFEPPSNS